jgi:hypothetical protein
LPDGGDDEFWQDRFGCPSKPLFATYRPTPRRRINIGTDAIEGTNAFDALLISMFVVLT